MIHFCTLLFRFLECQILTFVYLWISHIKKFARKIAKIEATLLTQWLVPKGWNDPALARTGPLTVGLGAGKDLLFESILGRCVSSNGKLKVKNGYSVKIWWGSHIPIRTNGHSIILSGMDLSICLMVKLEVFIKGQDNRIPQISSILQFSNLFFTQLWAYILFNCKHL